jgi:hypothetical protein
MQGKPKSLINESTAIPMFRLEVFHNDDKLCSGPWLMMQSSVTREYSLAVILFILLQCVRILACTLTVLKVVNQRGSCEVNENRSSWKLMDSEGSFRHYSGVRGLGRGTMEQERRHIFISSSGNISWHYKPA